MSLLLSTYQWPEALELVLESVRHQVKMPLEVLIADDGSAESSNAVIAKYRELLPIPLIHVWQEDEGFRKSMILNKAIAQANGDYIVQADGDCILHSHFVKDHESFAAENTYLFGSRVTIKKDHLPALFRAKQTRFSMFSTGIKKRTRALHIPILAYLYKRSLVFSSKYRGCNTSYFKKDFIKVNGYNEDFTGWGREDSELALRFLNAGLYGRRLRYKGIVFHIYHLEKSKDRVAINDSIEANTIKNKVVWCERGVDQYLS